MVDIVFTILDKCLELNRNPVSVNNLSLSFSNNSDTVNTSLSCRSLSSPCTSNTDDTESSKSLLPGACGRNAISFFDDIRSKSIPTVTVNYHIAAEATNQSRAQRLEGQLNGAAALRDGNVLSVERNVFIHDQTDSFHKTYHRAIVVFAQSEQHRHVIQLVVGRKHFEQ